MANRYWVGGSGNWSDAAAHWSDATNGTPGAGFLPTSADDVFFDANSNTGTGAFTVTVDGTSVSPSLCKNFSTGGAGGALDGAMTLSLSATAFIDVYGSLTLPATNLTWSGTAGARVTFRSTSAGNTITTNGVSLTNTRVQIDGVGGDWTLGSALTWGSNSIFGVANGSFSSANFNMTGAGFESIGTGTRSISLGSSTVALSATIAVNFSGSNFTFTSGTSTINCSAASPTFTGGGYTFYTVNFTATTNSTTTVTGANTFTNLSQTTPAVASFIRAITFAEDQTIPGTLTLGAANTAVRRIYVRSSVFGTQRTLTVGTLAALSDVDFQNIKAAGASSPWTGTRIGDCGGNTGITFTAASDKYWYSATGAGGNWSDAQWETTAGGTSPSVNNFPLAQDTVKFQNTGLGTGNTLTINNNWNLPSIDGTSRTNAMTLASGTAQPIIFGDLTLVSAMTITGTGSWRFSKQGTQNVTTNGVTTTWPVNIESGSGTVKAVDNWTSSNTLTLTSGTLDCNSKTITCTAVNANNSNTRTIAFGTGKIAVTANASTIVNFTTMTNFSYTGTPLIDATYSGATGTRTVTFASSANGATEANVVSLKVSAGSDTVSVTTSLKNLDLSGFSGTVQNNTRTLYGDLTVPATTTWGAGASATTFAATAGTQTITTNGVTLDFPITVNAPGATVQTVDNLTIGSTRTFTLTAGTLDLNTNKTLSCGVFASSGSTTRAITFGTGKIAVTGNAATVISMANLTSFTYTGTPLLDCTYSGATGTRSVQIGSTGGVEANAINVQVSAGSDAFATPTSVVCVFKTLDFTGFSGSITGQAKTIYGDLIVPATMSWPFSGNSTTFAASSGTQQITTNGVTIGQTFIFDCSGATAELQDAITFESTRNFQMFGGTVKLKSGTTNTANSWSFVGTVSKPITLQSTTPGSQATISDASGTNNATYLTVKDVVATGGATFNAFTGSGSTTSNNNVNNGNNLGWYFIPPGATFMNFF